MAMNTEDLATTRDEGSNQLMEAAGGVASEAGRAAESKASQSMSKVGDTLEQVARAVRDAGEGMREEQPQFAGFADTAAEQVERASQYLREHDAREAVDAAQDFARRQPLAVAAGGLALGLVVGRLLKSAGSASGSSRRHGAYGGYGSSYGYDSDRYTGESYAGGTYGGSSFGGRGYDRSSGAYAGAGYGSGSGTGGSDFDRRYGSGGTSGAMGTTGASTIASGESIQTGGSIDTGSATTPTGGTDRTDIGLADDTTTEDR